MSAHEPPAEPTTVVEDPATDPVGASPVVLIAAVIGAIALAAAVWFFLVSPLLLGDDAGAQGDPSTTAPSDVDPQPGSEETSPDGSSTDDPDLDGQLEELPLVTFEVFLSRDPFEPVVPEPASSAVGDETLSPDPDPVTGGDGAPSEIDPDDPTSPTAPPPSGADPDPAAPDGPSAGEPSCREGTETVCDGRVLSLVETGRDADGQLAVVQVDTTLYEVREGDIFARDFLVQSVADDRVRLLYGDEVVTLRAGERVLK